MKKLLLAGLLLVGASAFGSGYVSTEYEAYNYENTDSNFQRMETFVGLNDVLGGTLELRHRDTYNGSNNFRMRYTYNVTDQLSARYQYYTDGTTKAANRIQLRYKPTILNDIEGLSNWVVADFNKTEGSSAYVGAQTWTYYTVNQTIIPRLTFNNENYMSDISEYKDQTLNIDLWMDATVYTHEYNGFKFTVVGRAYNWLDYNVDGGEFINNHGVRAYAYVNKDFEILETPITTTLEYRIDYNLKSEEMYQYVAAKATYRF